MNISDKKWFISFAYRPPKSSNKTSFFAEITQSLNSAVNKFDNIVLMGDFNINILKNGLDTSKHLKDFSDTFSLTNLINTATCTKSSLGTAIDIMLTNRPRSFQHTCAVTTGLSDFHKLIVSCLRAHFKRLPPKHVFYRDYKHFNQENFLRDLDHEMIRGSFYQNEEQYAAFSAVFK